MAVSFADKIDNIRKEIMKESEKKSSEILTNALKWAENYSAEQSLNIENENKRNLEIFEKNCRNAADKKILQAELELKKIRTKKNSELVEKIFSEIKTEFKSLRNKPNYPELIKTMIIQAIRETNDSDLQIMTDRLDAELITADVLNSIKNFIFIESGRNINIKKSDEFIETFAGVIVKPCCGNYYITNTVEERFNAARSELKFLILSELQE